MATPSSDQTTDDPIRDVLQIFRDSGRTTKDVKALHQAGIIIWRLPNDAPAGHKLRPTNFELRDFAGPAPEPPRPGPADHHFVIHPPEGRTVTGRLTDPERLNGERGHTRLYSYTLLLWDGQHWREIDPEIEYIWA